MDVKMVLTTGLGTIVTFKDNLFTKKNIIDDNYKNISDDFS